MRALLLTLIAVGCVGTVQAEPLAKVSGVDAQPLKAQAERVAQALELLGAPLTGEQRKALDAALAEALDAWLDLARAERARWRGDGTPIHERRARLLDALLAARAARGAA